MTTTIIPVVAIAIAIVAAFVADKDGRTESQWPISRASWASVLAVIALAAANLVEGYGGDAWYAACGFAASAFALVAVASATPASSVIVGLALSTCVAGATHWLPAEHRIFGQLGAAAGAAIATWLLSSDDRDDLWLFSTFLVTLVAVDFLGGKGIAGRGFEHSGSMLGLAAAGAAMIGLIAGRSKSAATAPTAVTLIALGALFVGQRYLGIQDAWTLTVAGILAGIVTHWLLAEDRTDLLNILVAAVIWVGLATLGFALRRGYGMSLCLFGGMASLAVLGNKRALLTLGPLAGLVFYRVFKEMHMDATRSLDIGQHYALIGILIGAILPLLPLDWKAERKHTKTAMATATRILWVIILLGVPLFIGAILGPKGTVGFVAGLGMASLLEAARGRVSTAALALGAGLAFATTLLYGWLGELARLTRDDKLSALWPFAAGLLITAIMIALLSRSCDAKMEGEAI